MPLTSSCWWLTIVSFGHDSDGGGRLQGAHNGHAEWALWVNTHDLPLTPNLRHPHGTSRAAIAATQLLVMDMGATFSFGFAARFSLARVTAIKPISMSPRVDGSGTA